MKTIAPELWPVRQPTAGFVDATVERMLSAQPERIAPPAHRRWIRGLAIAALLMSGAAWGWQIQSEKRGAEPRITAPALTRSNSSPMQQRVVRVVLPSPPALSPQSVTAHPPARAPLLTPVPVPAPNPSASGGVSRSRVPACQCERGFSDFICDCY